MTDLELVYGTVLESYPQNTDKKGGSTSLHTQRGHVNIIESNNDIPKTLSTPPALPPRRTALESPKQERGKTWRLPLTKREKVLIIINIILATLVIVFCVLYITTENSTKHKTQEAKTTKGYRDFSNGTDEVYFEGAYVIENLMTRRYLLSTGERLASNGKNDKIKLPECVGSDDDYHYRAHWVMRNQGGNNYIIKNLKTKRCLWSTGDKFTGNRGDEGGWLKSPTCVGAADCNLARSHWKIINKDGGKYLIRNVGTKRYLLSTGGTITGNRGDEGGYSSAPLCVGSDENYENRAYWKLLND